MRRLDLENDEDRGDVKLLQSKPESGIGYQILSIEVSSGGDTFIAIALNAEFLVADLRELMMEPEEEYEDSSEDFLRGQSLVEAYAVRVWVPEAALSSYRFEESPFREYAETGMLGGGDQFPPPPDTGGSSYVAPRLAHRRSTGSEEGFVRYVAYSQDRRVTEDGGLSPGTYATTVNDAGSVPSGLAAVGRYALPNPRPARYASTVVPDPNTVIDYGTVVSMFGQAGGGVEAHFVNGTGPGTVSRPYEIPEG